MAMMCVATSGSVGLVQGLAVMHWPCVHDHAAGCSYLTEC